MAKLDESYSSGYAKENFESELLKILVNINNNLDDIKSWVAEVARK